MTGDIPSPFSLHNIRLFLAFRVLFNARFYYPVFTILFLDYGLTIEQFAILNTVWAFTIVLAEVPSGALADLLGRKRLLVGATALMICEMLLLAVVPLGNVSLVFSVFCLNRVLSGLAEALASGADEALAYDTLVLAGLAEAWPSVLEWEMRLRSLAHVAAMTLGALVYDPNIVNQLLRWLHGEGGLGQETTMRFPVYLTLALAIPAFVATLAMRDPQPQGHREGAVAANPWQVARLTLQAGGWIVRTPFALAIISFAMVFDHTLRMLVTMTSQYYRLISLPEATFGIIGSLTALLGLLVPRLARKMIERNTPGRNLVLLAIFAMAALIGMTLFLPYVGVAPMIAVFVAMMLTSFFASHYLNRITDSKQRATVLSFKGMAYNLAYGLIGVLYAALMGGLRSGVGGDHPGWDAAMVENEAFRLSIQWFPGYLAVALMVIALLTLPRLRLRSGDGS